MTDAVYEGRLQKIIRFCSVPRTTGEIAVELDVHEQTAREFVWDLKRHGRIKESIEKDGRRKKWEFVDAVETKGEIFVITQAGNLTLSTIVDSYGQPGPQTIDIVSGALAFMWRRAFYANQDQEKAGNVARQGMLNPYLQVIPILERVYMNAVAMTEILAFILHDMPDLWKSDPKIIHALGVVTPDRQIMLEGAAEWFEEWATKRLETM